MKNIISRLGAIAILAMASTAVSAQTDRPVQNSTGAKHAASQPHKNITRTDMLAETSRLFDRIDTNKDGELDKEELRHFKKESKELAQSKMSRSGRKGDSWSK